MRKDKNIAIQLRKRGLSYSQISSKLNIPKSTLSYWLRDLKLSKKAKDKIQKRVNKTSIKSLITRNKKQTFLANKRAEYIKSVAIKEVEKLINNKLFLLGISLYWAEGYKKGAYGSKWKSVDFANSDPEMIVVMMKFFREICNVREDKIKLQVIAHKNIKKREAISFWSKATGIPKQQFFKISNPTNDKGNTRKRKGNTLPHGTVHIRINDVKLFFRIIGWIEGIKKMKNNLHKTE